MEASRLPDAFYLDLDDAPGDETTLCALADWYEERGELPTAECIRWTIRRGLHPMRFSHADTSGIQRVGPSFHEDWYWWAIDDPDEVQRPCCRLPATLWNRLAHSFPYVPSFFKEYPTRRAAYEALFEAWAVAAPRVRRREGAR